MITRAYIQELGGGKMEPEFHDVGKTLQNRGISVALYTLKRLRRDQIPFDRETLVAGDHDAMQIVCKRIGFRPTLTCYPQSLRQHLKRRTWESTLIDILEDDPTGSFLDVFIKPKTRSKLFTGFVVESIKDLYRLGDFSGKTEIYCSEKVSWRSEFRAYVANGVLLGIHHYSGEGDLWPDLRELQRMVEDFEASSERTAGYAIDVGVMADGRTALVEWNDGYALGNYGLPADQYTDLILARWEEILAGAAGA